MSRDKNQTRSVQVTLNTRGEANSEDMYIEGYFAVFNKETVLFPGAYEEIAPGAFDETLENDIRALVNHDTTLVLGRNKSGSLQLKADSHGLWGKIKINPADADAVNLYERVKRGDVDQCSFGFNILDEQTDMRNDGSIKWLIRKIDLHEVSVCTFPAYEDTGVLARKAEFAKRQLPPDLLEERKRKLRAKLENITRRWNKNDAKKKREAK